MTSFNDMVQKCEDLMESRVPGFKQRLETYRKSKEEHEAILDSKFGYDIHSKVMLNWYSEDKRKQDIEHALAHLKQGN